MNKIDLDNAVALAKKLKYTTSYLTKEANIAILACVGKECNFKLVRERSYANTPNRRLRKIFGERLGYCQNDEWLDYMKSNDELFFSTVYANRCGNGSIVSGDGYRYRGGGFNQLTFKDNYCNYSTEKYNLNANPSLINDPEIASEVCLKYFKRLNKYSKNRLHKLYGCDLTNVDSIGKAMEIVLHLNAGIGRHRYSPVLIRAHFNASKYLKIVTPIYESVWR